MARAYTFRIAPEGWAEFKKLLEELGPAGEAALKKIADTSPQLADAATRAEKALGAAKARMEETARAGEDFARRGTTSALGFETAMGRGREAATQMAFALSDLARGGSVSFNSIAGAASRMVFALSGPQAALAAAALLAAGAAAETFLFRDASEEAAKAQDNYAAAVKAANEFLGTSIERARAAAEESRKSALEKNLETLATQRLTVAERERELAGLQGQLATLRGATPLVGGALGREAAEQQGSVLAEIERRAEAAAAALSDARRQLAGLEENITRLSSSSAVSGGILGDLAGVRNKLDPAVAAMAEFASTSRTLNAALAAGEIDWAEYSRLVGLADKQLQDALDKLAPAPKKYDELHFSVRRAAEAAREYEAGMAAAKERSAALLKAEAERANAITRDVMTAEEKHAVQLAEANRLREQGAITAETYARRVAQIGEELRKSDPAYQEAMRAAEQYRRTMERTIEHSTERVTDFAADAFDRILDRGKTTWRELGAEFIGVMRRAFAQAAANAFVTPAFEFSPSVLAGLRRTDLARALEGQP
jgi:hypothetical protein